MRVVIISYATEIKNVILILKKSLKSLCILHSPNMHKIGWSWHVNENKCKYVCVALRAIYTQNGCRLTIFNTIFFSKISFNANNIRTYRIQNFFNLFNRFFISLHPFYSERQVRNFAVMLLGKYQCTERWMHKQ